jgi:hypothetical protein
MNNPASNTESSKPSKSVKQSHRVEAKLARRKKAESDAISETVTTPASAIELIPASPPHPSRRFTSRRKLPNPVEIVPELQLRKVERVDPKTLMHRLSAPSFGDGADNPS